MHVARNDQASTTTNHKLPALPDRPAIRQRPSAHRAESLAIILICGCIMICFFPRARRPCRTAATSGGPWPSMGGGFD